MRIESIAIPLIRHVARRPRLAAAFFRLDSWGNPLLPERLSDPMLQAHLIRADPPVVWKPLYQQWFVTGYDEAREALGSTSAGVANQVDVLLDVRPFTKMSDQARRFVRNLMLLTDPPQHTRLRGLVNRAFTPRRVSSVDERMVEIIDELIAELPDREFDLMTSFAQPFPARVIGELFGIPEPDIEWLRDVSTSLVKITDIMVGFDPDEVSDAVADFSARILELAAERLREPRADLITGLAQAEDDDGDRLSDDELVAVAGIILIAGHETTSIMLALSLLALYEHPDQLTLIRQRPELWPNAVEELLRFDTALRSDPRCAIEDFELAGNPIKKGQNILILNNMANRDLRRWPDADTLRLDRQEPMGLSFGHGVHYCLGANLARAELLAALPRLLDVLGDYRVDTDAIQWRPSTVLRSIDRFPVTGG